jgi:hypothetical protein
MILDLSDQEIKTVSTACAVAIEVAKCRLGEGQVAPEDMLAGFTADTLDRFIRICIQIEAELNAYETYQSLPVGTATGP